MLGSPPRGGGARASRRPLLGAERDGECCEPRTHPQKTPGSGDLSKQDLTLLCGGTPYIEQQKGSEDRGGRANKIMPSSSCWVRRVGREEEVP